MWYIQWYTSEGIGGTAKGQFAVYFRTQQQAYQAMRGWLLDHAVDGFNVKEVDNDK